MKGYNGIKINIGFKFISRGLTFKENSVYKSKITEEEKNLLNKMDGQKILINKKVMNLRG